MPGGDRQRVGQSVGFNARSDWTSLLLSYHGVTNMSRAEQSPGGGRVADRTDRAVRSSRAAIMLLLVGGLAYSWLLGTHLAPYAAGADPSGYLNFARLLTHGQVLAPVRALPGHTVTAFGEGTYQPQGFVIRDDSGFMAPTYSVGLPVHLVLATWLVGLKYAVGLVNVFAALVTGAVTYASCRHLKLGPAWAVGATLTLCVSPFFLISALQPMSDLLATTWALVTLYGAMRSRERVFWAIMCGVAFGIAVLMRPTNVLLAFPILVALGFNVRRLAGTALGALPSALLLLYLNFRLFGSPLTTGYGSPIQILDVVRADTTQPYSIAYVRHHLTSFAYWITLYMGPLVAMRPGAALCSARSYPRLGHAGSMDSGTHRILCLLPTFWRVMGLYSFSPSVSPAISHACHRRPLRHLAAFGRNLSDAGKAVGPLP